MQRRILLHMMTELGQEPDFCKVREMQQRALQGSGKTELCYGTALCADEKSIWIDTAVFTQISVNLILNSRLRKENRLIFRKKCLGEFLFSRRI